MLEYLWLPYVVTIAAMALSAILIKEFLRKRAGQIAVEGGADNDSATQNGTVERAARTCTSPPVNEMTTFSRSDYEVFFSFKGRDTRAGFTDFLYTSLKDAGICTFRDDEELRVGEEFAPELLQAIKQSKILIPIFSKSYASSIWCLKELVQMVECQKTGGQKIMPIFYDVAPSEVRHQTGSYGEAFLSHKRKRRNDQKTIGDWKDALNAVAKINGWDLQSMPNRQEGQFAKTITQKVFNELKKAYLVVSNCLVNVDNHVDAIMELTGAQTSETWIIGIYGIGGIGKTTIAKIIYNKLLKNFESCCFLSNIHETSERKGMEFLQDQLISDILKNKCTDIRNIDDGIKIIKNRLSNKRVILLLDDVHEKNHIDALVGERDWFGKGSKLIITTRNKEVLDVLKVDSRYDLSGMDHDQSLQLFSKHAFRRDHPLDEYINRSERAIKIARGLPLALEVMGSLLACTKKKKWDSKLAKLESDPRKDVRSKLKISYDVLEDKEKQIFLDIACLLIGYDKDVMVHFWKSEFHPEDAIDVLENMSLIKIRKDNKVWMHDQLRDLGRQIVCQEMNINKQIRVWDPEKALDLLKSHETKKKVEALHLHLDHQHRCTYKDFKSLPRLRFLEVDDSKPTFCVEKMLLQHKGPSNVLPPNVLNSNLLPQLRWLSWHNIHPTFEIANFSVENLIVLDLSWSEITHYWKGWSHMKVIKNLKVLDLTKCRCLRITPDLSAHSKLERLILWGCASLIEIDRSMCQLKCLVFLDVSYCLHLQRLPDKLGGDLASLKYLFTERCKSLHMLPETIGNLESLTDLDIRGTCIKELPNSIGKMKNLKVVKIHSTYISKIPDVFWTIEKLEEITVYSYCYEYGDHCCFEYDDHCFDSDGDFQVEIGNCIYGNKSLRILRLISAIIHAPRKLPESLIELELEWLGVDTFPDLSKLTNLKGLHLRFGPSIASGLPEEPIPRWIGNLSKLESLELVFFRETASWTDLSLRPHPRRLPTLPSNLSSLDLLGFHSLCSMDLSNLRKLSSLSISFSEVAEIEGLGCLENLQYLKLDNVEQLAMLPDLSKSNKLRHIRVAACDNLVEIQGELPRFLNELKINYCNSLQEFPDLFSLMGKTDVHVHIRNQKFQYGPHYRMLNYAFIGGHELLLDGFKQMQIPDLSNWNRLTILTVESCHNLVEIQGELPQSLEILWIQCCESLQKLPDLSSLKGLREVTIRRCGKLAVEEISQLCSEKSIIFVGEDEFVEEDDEEDEFVEEDDE